MQDPHEPGMVADMERHELGWLVSCQPPAYARSRDYRGMFIGQGPFLVDALDGSPHMVHRQFCCDGPEWPDQYPDQYREKVRGEIPPWELDVQVQRLTALGGKAEA
ncbi:MULTISPECIES: YrhB domain-containing protein [unclassified Streptomyces]|uniref:YrhB domain-containing protein n=1 Tax=unclassified Streptomyces TaxID=2593676 RepID=UPI0022577684|nr:YrhB domain-containing protein [Streptomyces sp. NBC_00047]MCX5610015.1 YrhB family protein [Streptomyces sp. NBC_00047]